MREQGTISTEREPLHMLRPREQQALDELGTTTFAPGARRTLIAIFLGVVFTVPVFDAVRDVIDHTETRREMLAAHADSSTIPGRRPQALDITLLLPKREQVAAARTFRDYVNLVPKPAAMREYEDNMVLNSPTGKAVRPWYQYALMKYGGAGNQRVVLGRDGSLFYTDGLNYVNGAGFLDSTHIREYREHGLNGNPLPAIIQFNELLKSIGVTLLVLPMPDRTQIAPELLAHGLPANTGLQNVSWNAFVKALNEHDVQWIDMTPPLLKAERDSVHPYLRGDTHFSPSGLEITADEVERVLRANGVTNGAPGTYTRELVRWDHRSDMVLMLNIPEGMDQRWQLWEPMNVGRIRDRAGNYWKTDSTSEVLFLGDSFMQAYTDERHGVIAAAGLVQQLSYRFQRPFDRRADSFYSTYDARAFLGNNLAEVRRNTAGKKVVVWEFVIRKLSLRDWGVYQ